jgi:hypothetical protein
MQRCWLPIAALTFLSCGSSLSPPVYPSDVAGGYRLHRENIVAGDQLHKGVPAAGLLRAVQLVYDASNPIQLTVYETTSSAVALEAIQTWRAQTGAYAVQIGRLFVIAQSEKPDPAGMRAFLADFEKQLNSQRR